MRAALFGGTADGRALALRLRELDIPLAISVATDYGRELLSSFCSEDVFKGRMDQAQMIEFFRSQQITAVVDATHPYADLVTENISAAASALHLPYYRLMREKSDLSGCLKVKDAASAAKAAQKLPGNILITTGSKEILAFQSIFERAYARILPGVEPIKCCLDAGLAAKRIIAMQGPFSAELNAALMRALSIRVMITKDGGKTGGFPEKLAAARECSVTPIVIVRPVEQGGLTAEEIIEALKWEKMSEIAGKDKSL